MITTRDVIYTTVILVLAFGLAMSMGQERYLEQRIQEAHASAVQNQQRIDSLQRDLKLANRLWRRVRPNSEPPASLARRIIRHAEDAGIPRHIAFRLVDVESDFRRRAISHANARGYTQVLPSTARDLKPGLSMRNLFDADVNLSLGFQYLRILLDRYDGNFHLALTAYNRGPRNVNADLAAGKDPSNGYSEDVLKR